MITYIIGNKLTMAIHRYIVPLHYAYMEICTFKKGSEVITYSSRTVDYKYIVWC